MGDFHTMITKQGRVFTPLSTNDVIDVVREEVGDEIADYLEEVMIDVDLEEKMAEKKFNSDFDAMECEVECWHQFVDDISEEIEAVRRNIEDNKLTKAKISIALWRIYEKMRKEL